MPPITDIHRNTVQVFEPEDPEETYVWLIANERLDGHPSILRQAILRLSVENARQLSRQLQELTEGKDT